MRQLSAFLSALLLFAVIASCSHEENDSYENENPGYKTVHVTSIFLNQTSVTIKEGESFTLIPTLAPDNADNKNVTWSSSSEAVATVDNCGKVTGIKAGSNHNGHCRRQRDEGDVHLKRRSQSGPLSDSRC